MKAAVFNAVGSPLEIRDLPDPKPAPGQVVLRVGRCGICGSDLHLTDGKGFTPPAGSVLGHEYSGEVVELGAGVTKLKIGDRVAAMPISGCGACASCLAGEPSWCAEGMRYFAGGYAEYTLAGQGECIRLPSGLSDADGALAEPLAVALHGVSRALGVHTDKVLVMGAGPIGLGVIYWARRLGVTHIDVVEGNPARQELAMAMGAESCRAPAKQEVNAPTPGQNAKAYDLPQVVFECVGRPGLLADAIGLVRPRGTVVSLGFCMAPESMIAAVAATKEVTLQFPVLYTVRDYQKTVDALSAGAVQPRAMITDTVGFSRLPSMFEELRSPGHHCKVMIDPRKTAGSM